MTTIPIDFYQALCQDIDYPLAAVDESSRFCWVNNAFERLVGYAITELLGMKWQGITANNDVGADMAGVAALLSGRINSYRIEKKYVHKRGHLVPVELTVRRYPTSSHENLTLFRVEAAPQRPTKQELDAMHDELMTIIKDLRRRIEVTEHRDQHQGHIMNVLGDNVTQGDKVSGAKTTNSDLTIKRLTWAFAILTGALVSLFYYVAAVQNKQEVEPPTSVTKKIE